MSKRQPQVDFSKHKLDTTITEHVNIHYLYKEGTCTADVKFINVQGVLVVTSAYGNWMFCRSFVPSAESEKVSDEHWKEKAQIKSNQAVNRFSEEKTRKYLQDMIDGGLEEYGYSDDKLSRSINYFKEAIDYLDLGEERFDTYISENLPGFMDYDEIPKQYETIPSLDIIFDAYDEIIDRYKSGNLNPDETK